MAVKKEITIDLSNLTSKDIDEANRIMDAVQQNLKTKKKIDIDETNKITDTVKQDLKTEKKFEKLRKKLDFEKISTPEADTLREKIFGREAASTVFNFARNPIGTVGSLLQKIPGPLIIAIPIIVEIFNRLKKIDDEQKRFIESEDNRVTQRRAEDTARINAGLQQVILTTSAGGAEPRDSYNSFRIFNENQSQIQADFTLRNTSGYD